MTSYMYNPSKKVTELLSKYLEFDPEQLELAIWSGNLSLSDVHLRQEAVYPLLNNISNKSGATSPTATATASTTDEQFVFGGTSQQPQPQQSQQQQQEYDVKKPPLKFKLVHGKIGNLSMKIPWKRLVWGQGDVQVDLRNVTLVLALESREETEQRNKKSNESASDPGGSTGSEPKRSSNNQYEQVLWTKNKKRQILREAERRLVRGRSIGPWLCAMKRKEEQELAAKHRSKVGDGDSGGTSSRKSQGDGGTTVRWLRSLTNDFFWRFCAGLQMNVENVKIVIVQDGIELGIIMPSNKLVAGGKLGGGGLSLKRKVSRHLTEIDENNTDDSAAAAAAASTTMMPPQEGIVYRGEYDDGEHVDKQLKQIGIGIYVRALHHHHNNNNRSSYDEHWDIHTRDYILRPVDVDLDFSLFFPLPVEKRNKRKAVPAVAAKLTSDPAGDDSTERRSGETASSTVTGSESSSKRRRGKRDKQPLPISETTKTAETLDVTPGSPRTSPQSVRSGKSRSADSAILTSSLKHLQLKRYSSTDSPRRRGLRRRNPGLLLGAPGHKRHNTTTTLPLAQPDDVGAYFASKTNNDRGGVKPTASVEGSLSVGALQAVCSNRHYSLINQFLAAGARMRNGRPNKTIRSVLEDDWAAKRRESELLMGTQIDLRELQGQFAVDTERRSVVQSWWRYVLGVLLWELRQRKRLRRLFQQKYISFDWDRQSYRRSEYVELFIALRLTKNGSNDFRAFSSSSTTDSDKRLTAIEDELAIEQILLYRSIARNVHVRGHFRMPDTIIDVQTESDLTGRGSNSHNSQPARNEDGEENASNAGTEDDNQNFLAILEKRCETARARREAGCHVPLPSYNPFEKRPNTYGPELASELEDQSFSLFSEVRTVKTHRSHKSRSSIATSAVDRIREVESAPPGMLFSFTARCKKLELLVIEEKAISNRYATSHDGSVGQGNERMDLSGGNVSDLSVLTDDERFFEEQDNLSPAAAEEANGPTDPIFLSTDYLLFRLPEKILLRMVAESLSCSLMGRSGGSRNMNFAISRVAAVGEADVLLLSVGTSPLGEAPVQMIDLSKQAGNNSITAEHSLDDKNAFSLSLVDKKYHRFVQCDMPTVCGVADILTVSSLIAFVNESSVLFPSQLLRKSPREEVRLYVLQQNESPLSSINCSVRIHGFELSVPLRSDKAELSVSHSGSCSDSFNAKKHDGPMLLLSCEMIEMYSGSVVEELSASMEEWRLEEEPSLALLSQPTRDTNIRKLSMLDVPELLASSASSLSSRWVIATSGVDMNLVESPLTKSSFLEEPFDIEILYGQNSDSILDFNRAKQEITVEVSPIHLLVSEERIHGLSMIQMPTMTHTLDGDSEFLPPRLEVLSTFMKYSVDLSCGRVRVSFLFEGGKANNTLETKTQLMERSMRHFLTVVSRFDLSFPHEDALSAAMQICIDRLAGMGLPLDFAWEATNLALLNLLEDIASARSAQDEASRTAGFPKEDLASEEELLKLAISKTAERTVATYVERVVTDDSEYQPFSGDVVLDFPDGVACTYVGLFYDHHLSVGIPTMFVANKSGVHLLRVTPETGISNGSRKESIFESSEKAENSVGTGAYNRSSPFGISMQRFSLDTRQRFGRGGLPLAVLGTDDWSGNAEERTREQLDDLEIGDVEITFCREIYHEILGSLRRTFSSFRLGGDQELAKTNRSGTVETHLLAAVGSATALFVSDLLFPFTRVVLGTVVSTKDSMLNSDSLIRSQLRFSSDSFGLLNLTPEGELHPSAISVLPQHVGTCLFAEYTRSDTSSFLAIDLHGLRVVLLRQFLNEFLQYFVSGSYGLSHLLQFMKGSRDQSEHSAGPPFLYKISLHESSLLLPQSSSSYDMIGMEFKETVISYNKVKETFSVPLRLDEADSYVSDGIARTLISIHGFRIFSSLLEENPSGANRALDSPSFRFSFAVDGRAAAGKSVYCQCSHVTEGQDLHSSNARANLCWRELTAELSSIDIVADYAPHLRLLITDPLDKYPGAGLQLDLRLSQFCLLLSVWYCNMQELPTMFPYSAEQLQVASKLFRREQRLPEYGSKELIWLFKLEIGPTTEFMIVMDQLSLRCSFDRDSALGISLKFLDAVVHVKSDVNGITKVGSGSSGAFLVDESKTYSDVLAVRNTGSHEYSFADLHFGLDKDRRSLDEGLPQAFQLSVFMTPDWSLYNLGMDSASMTLSDFTPIFKFLEFVTSYFVEERFGNPSFQAEKQAKRIKHELSKKLEQTFDDSSQEGSGIDFRLWLVKPTVIVPCDPSDRNGPGVRLKENGGLWYKYTAIGTSQSQECISEQLGLLFDDMCAVNDAGKDDDESKTLIENLSLGLRLDSNSSSDHTDVCVVVPYVDKDACGLCSERICCQPNVMKAATICEPYEDPSRSLGPYICGVTCIIEVLPLASSALLNLFTGDSSEVAATDDRSIPGTTGSALQIEELLEEDDSVDGSKHTRVSSKADGTYSIVASVGDIRVFALDPVLGPHLPVAVLSLASAKCTASRFAEPGSSVDLVRGEAPPEDRQISIECLLWADYFKLGLTRSWEPLIEAYRFCCSIEKSRFRGSGVAMNSDSVLQVNISSALLVILDEVIDVFKRLVSETFGTEQPPDNHEDDANVALKRNSRARLADYVNGTEILHEMPNSLTHQDRVAFSMRNMTGQQIRIFSLSGNQGHSTVLKYLGHKESTKLNFSPSISIIKNMKVAEVAYPGFPESYRADVSDVPHHAVNIQVPGFQWLETIAVDTFGRNFAHVVPRSAAIREKVTGDWRLFNVMKVLVQVGLENGGRQVTVQSIFRVDNRTTHGIDLLLNPDPAFHSRGAGPDGPDRPSSTEDQMDNYEIADSTVEPGSSFHIPILLLESSLRQLGSHLGSMWLKPGRGICDTDVFRSFVGENAARSQDLNVDFCSRPVQLAKVVSESATIFHDARGLDVSPDDAKSGLQVSCPVTRNTGDRLAPFCYAVEIGRSPLVEARSQENGENPPKSRRKNHGPVAYTLSIHAPLIIANLLPEKGRFELMHAVNHRVLWFADLEPGQQVPIHSVGLDAPLFLFVNLGFARTPVGEGALIHHGTSESQGLRENLGGLKSIGKAGKAVTKQIGRTLTSMGESVDQRAQQKLNVAQYQQANSSNEKRGRVLRAEDKTDLGFDTGVSGKDSVGGKTYKIDSFDYFPSDVVEETAIVDGIGQRLILSIENIRGGGGQRRISVYCRFWIVNTTEHCLRYKQENSKLFVSGTVHSPDKNGSLPLSGGRSQAKYDSLSSSRRSTVFAGTPGALASTPGVCDLPPAEVAPLLDTKLPLEKLSKLAFMFSFQEGPVMTIGQQRLCVQLGDGTGATPYESDWSRGFSPVSVGIAQVVSLHCKDGRSLELSVAINVAPGFLSSYTKIIRFLPRYVLVNNLPFPVRIWQDSSVFRPMSTVQGSANQRNATWKYSRDQAKVSKVNQYESLWGREARLDDRSTQRMPPGTAASGAALYITTAFPNEIVPFSLPDSRGERQLRIDVGKPWDLTSSFSSDAPGDHIISIKHAVDLRFLPHVSTRSNPKYEVRLPPMDDRFFTGELGVWFATEWGANRGVIVKAVKKNSFAFNETDIHVGDELLAVNGAPLDKLAFVDAMKTLKGHLDAACSTRSFKELRLGRSGTQPASSARQKQGFLDNSGNADECVLTFRTVEERLRMVRLKAAKASGDLRRLSALGFSGQQVRPSNASPALNQETLSGFHIQAELKKLQRSDVGMLLQLKRDPVVPFRIQNHAITSTIYFRQKGCSEHKWQSLKPGASTVYSWEEPLKPKRLTLRVAADNTFSLLEDKESDGIQFEQDLPTKSVDAERRRRRGRTGKLNDEEDAIFSPSINIRLEDIGYQTYLPLYSSVQKKDAPGQLSRCLKLEVDVEGPIRVLRVQDSTREESEAQDATREGVEAQLGRHLKSLETKVGEEKKRLDSLKTIGLVLDGGTSCDGFSSHGEEESKKLMRNFPDKSTVDDCHQIIVEVLEAIGLSSGSFIGSCNPYAEVRLKSGGRSGGRFLFWRRKDRRKTYYIRKSVTPCWISQSFVFKVPPEAVSVARGHSVQVSMRSFQALGRNQILGQAQVDLHSIRDQEPLIGWFPLAGRTGRLELENRLSHWGRGSVKLRVQWIYNTKGLLRYFLMLSERRLLVLRGSLEGLKEQMESKREADKKKSAGFDGFKAARIQDLLNLSHNNMKARAAQLQKLKKMNRSVVKKLIEPLRPHSDRKFRRRSAIGSPIDKTTGFQGLNAIVESKPAQQTNVPLSRSLTNEFTVRRRLNSNSEFIQKLEDRITLQRQSFQKFTSSRQRLERIPSYHGDSGIFALSTFKDWACLQALLNDNGFEMDLVGDAVRIKLRHDKSSTIEQKAGTMCEKFIWEKLAIPRNAPLSLRLSVDKYVAEFLQSRASFERSAKMAIKTVLNPGGWLTIRPVTALNLPDGYSGMYVKCMYGSEVLVSETTDARVTPRWGKAQSSTMDDEKGQPSDSPSDIHIHVAPQKTSGSIRVSVVGLSHQKLQARGELGVVHLPLGSVITACIDAAETDLSRLIESSSIENSQPMYIRWFPLKTPKDATRVEGDGGLSTRPPDTEKTRDNLFREYFAPCIQLALMWTPDTNAEEDTPLESSDADSLLENSPAARGAYEVSSVLRNYVIADIGRIAVALIDSHRATELLSFTALDIDLRYWVTSAKARMGVTIGWLQLDYQGVNAREPIVLAPTPTDNLLPVLQTVAVKDNLQSDAEIVSFDFVDVSIAEFDLTIEERLVWDMISFFDMVAHRRGLRDRRSAGKSTEVEIESTHRNQSLMKTGDDYIGPSMLMLLSTVSDSGSDKGRKVYIRQLYLGRVRINLSYVRGKKPPREAGALGGSGMRIDDVIEEYLGESLFFHTESSDMFVAWSQHIYSEVRTFEKTSHNTPALFATLFPNVSDAPIRFAGKSLCHVFESPSEIFDSVRKFYSNEFLKQLYKIVGSLDFVGNPTMLVTSFASGVRDLFVAPSVAFLKSPTDPSGVGIGVAQGTLSLFSHSTSGFFAVLAKVSAAAGHGVATLSLDSEFRDWHRDTVLVEATNLNRVWKRRGVQGAGRMLARPAADIILGVARGVGGIFVLPVKGYRKRGQVGIARGVVIGAIGLITKPTVGILDAFAHLAASIHDIAKSVNVLDRRLQPALKLRLPYAFGMKSILSSFDAGAARSSNFLQRYPVRESRRIHGLVEPEILVHTEILPSVGSETFAIATSRRVLLVRVNKESTGLLTSSLSWEVSFSTESSISSRVDDHGHNGVALTILKRGHQISEDDLSDSLSSTPSRSATSSMKSMGLSSPEEKLTAETVGGDFNHGTGRGAEGELLEWFTVLAEYQYRRQLTRFHNAISCITGNFDAIIHDPSLGRPKSTEGYTSFGMFFFSKEATDRKEEIGLAVADMGDFPWVHKSIFSDLHYKPSEEQARSLAGLRSEWDFEHELEASKRESGPDWLVLARARAMFIDTSENLIRKDSGFYLANRADLSPVKRRLPTIPDEGSGDEDTDPVGDPLSSTLPESRALVQLDRKDPHSFLSPTLSSPHADRRSPQPSFRSSNKRRRSGSSSFARQSDSTQLSFVTAANANESESFQFSRESSSAISTKNSASCFESAREFAYPGYESPNIGMQDASNNGDQSADVSSSSKEDASEPEIIEVSGGRLPETDEVSALRESEIREGSDGRAPETGEVIDGQEPEIGEVIDERALEIRDVSSGQHRMDRMEALLERLLILSSEQALRNYQPAEPESNEVALLRREVEELRAQFERQRPPSEGGVDAEELASLRREIASLREQVTTGRPPLLESDTSPSTRHNDNDAAETAIVPFLEQAET